MNVAVNRKRQSKCLRELLLSGFGFLINTFQSIWLRGRALQMSLGHSSGTSMVQSWVGRLVNDFCIRLSKRNCCTVDLSSVRVTWKSPAPGWKGWRLHGSYALEIQYIAFDSCLSYYTTDSPSCKSPLPLCANPFPQTDFFLKTRLVILKASSREKKRPLCELVCLIFRLDWCTQLE